MSPLGDLARQDDYLPDVGEPLVSGGPQFSPGVPAVNNFMGRLLAPQARDENSPVQYRTASPLVNITGQDIQDATNAAQAFSGGGLGIKAYHSSPHDFEKFDLSKVGTGEGAQVYGHGLYFAENPKVSGQGGQYWRAFSERFREGPEGKAVQYLRSSDLDRSAAIKKLEDDLYAHNQNVKEGTTYMPPAEDARYAQQLMQARDLLASDKPVGPRTYEVDINADPAHMLDWDKPLREQQHLMDKLYDAGMTTKSLDTSRLPAGEWGQMQAQFINDLAEQPGSAIYRRNTRSPEHASHVLNEAGIPGIKYLDEGSRGMARQSDELLKIYGTPERVREVAQQSIKSGSSDSAYWQSILRGLGDRTHNYVVFNSGIIDILRKYGIAGAAPLGIGALAAQDNYQQEE